MDFSMIPLRGKGGLIDMAKSVNDPRAKKGRRFPSYSIISLVICANLSGANSVRAVADWVLSLSVHELQRFGIRKGKPPSEPTIRRLLALLDFDQLDSIIRTWLLQHGPAKDRAIALDGKVLRGTRDGAIAAISLLSAVMHNCGVTLGQVQIDPRSNEIKAVKPLLNKLDVADCVLTLDAIHTQTETARMIVEESRANYMMTVKGNQKGLREEIELLGMSSFSPST